MKKIICAAVIGCLPLSAACADDGMQQNVETGRTIIKEFFGNLKGELVSAMKQGGPVHAISVCNTVAPTLAHQQSEKHGWEVARTSLKVRNPDNAPDAWEKAVLDKFDQRKAAGEDPTKIAYYEVVEENGERYFRMMKAIPTGEVCLKCHGSNIAVPVRAKLDELYPGDTARGYSAGDIRGAFTLKKKL